MPSSSTDTACRGPGLGLELVRLLSWWVRLPCVFSSLFSDLWGGWLRWVIGGSPSLEWVVDHRLRFILFSSLRPGLSFVHVWMGTFLLALQSLFPMVEVWVSSVPVVDIHGLWIGPLVFIHGCLVLDLPI